ncbi:helix-turn-helix transcriptional regulator [Gordonibacter sp. An230]|uniref:helix-turn-helix transcriptional regulator n=1 Tax=Gordonibacter sp. An230 TaxID=1965592 RepID=UPI000B3AE313|nr:helix-turn-helix transcriptional regulator [Gordonibacter sp. An230]OUO91242.1 helix-turn-helix transcriptional regulator [Gordonibacter sp. An230]
MARTRTNIAFSAAVIVGFGLYRGVSSSAYLSAFASVESPFMFVPDLFFNMVVACSIIVCSVVVVALALTGRLEANSMPYCAPAALLLSGGALAVMGARLGLPSEAALLVPGVLYGVGSVMLSLFWIEALATDAPSAIAARIAFGMLLAVAVSSALSAFSADAQMWLSCALLAVTTGCARFARRRMSVADASGRGVGPSGVSGASEGKASCGRALARVRWDACRGALLEVGDALAAFFVLEAVIGLLNSFMLAGFVGFEGSGAVSAAAIAGAIIVFCLVVFVARRMPKVSTVSGAIMPVLAAMLVLLPFLSERYRLAFSLLLLGSYWFVALIVTYLVAEAANVRKAPPYVLMGVAMGGARACLAVSLAAGFAAAAAGGGPGDEAERTMRYLAIIVVVLYLLCMALVFVSRGRKRRPSSDERSALGFDFGGGAYRFGRVLGRRPVDSEGAFGAGSARGFERRVGLGASGASGSSSSCSPATSLPSALQAGCSSSSPVAGADASAADTGAVAALADSRVKGCAPALDERCAAVAREGGLTGREAEILVYLARGRTKAYVADALFVTENTVRSHVRNIYSKLGVHTRQELLDLVYR